MDERYRVVRAGLDQLTTHELREILEYRGDMVFDTYNYHDGAYCPLAVAIGIPGLGLPEMSNSLCQRLMTEIGGRRGRFVFNQLSGVPGEFYTTDRAADAAAVVREILAEREPQVPH